MDAAAKHYAKMPSKTVSTIAHYSESPCLLSPQHTDSAALQIQQASKGSVLVMISLHMNFSSKDCHNGQENVRRQIRP